MLLRIWFCALNEDLLIFIFFNILILTTLRDMKKLILLSGLFILIACNSNKQEPGAFASDEVFLEKHTDAIILTNGDAAVIVVPAYQGRVMTSTYDRKHGPTFGWINRPVIEKGFMSEEETKGKLEEHIYIFGGEERFWLGPEGGQYALYFKPGDKFEFADWKTPALIDTEPFDLINNTETSATFKRQAVLENYSGTLFDMKIQRRIGLLDNADVEECLDIVLSKDIRIVAYETDNRLTNIGNKAWTAEGGLPSIWLLGMYNPSPSTTIVIPFKEGAEEDLGPKVNDTYFGKVPADYLTVDEQVLFLKGDGTYRSKIGVNDKRSLGVAGSYDAVGQVLTIVKYNVQTARNGYVNSMWEFQDEPFHGDVINAYNDGPPEPGVAPMGPFYELESSSPAADLAPGEVMQHVQKTIHLHGTEKVLDPVALKVFGVTLNQIKKAKV